MCKQRLICQESCKRLQILRGREGIRRDGCRAVFSSVGQGPFHFPLCPPRLGKGRRRVSTVCGHREQANECIYNKESVAMREREKERQRESNSSSLPLKHRFSTQGAAHWNIWGSRAERHPIKYGKLRCLAPQGDARRCFALYTHYLHSC